MRNHLKTVYRFLASPAHHAERPLHVAYFLSVGYYAGGVYGTLAVACGIVTILGAGDPPHASS